MKEQFLHYIWQYQLFNHQNLKTQDGESLEIIKAGLPNTDAGPDFSAARIKIGSVTLVGNVEIHHKTSDWIFHGHSGDKNYENIILHVVFKHDTDLDVKFPTLVLQEYIPKEVIFKYRDILEQPKKFIPCENLLDQPLDDFKMKIWYESLFIQRMQRKVERLHQRAEELQNDFEALLFEELSAAMGLKINQQAFLMLARSFSFKVLQKNVEKQQWLEALLFGQAGFLTAGGIKDAYQKELRTHYDFLQNKFQLKPLEQHLFKYLRLRPPNFPTIRIAQLAGIYHAYPKLFAAANSMSSWNEFQQLFSEVKTTSYWDNHYNFQSESQTKRKKNIGDSRVEILLLNAIIPVRWCFEQYLGQSNQDLFFDILEKMSPEKNRIIENYASLKFPVENALHSQALLELNKQYCLPKKCLNCQIGHELLRS